MGLIKLALWDILPLNPAARIWFAVTIGLHRIFGDNEINLYVVLHKITLAHPFAEQ